MPCGQTISIFLKFLNLEKQKVRLMKWECIGNGEWRVLGLSGQGTRFAFFRRRKKKKKHKKKPKKKQTTAMHARSLILFYVHGSERRCSGG
jgi:hypothetical protein